MPTTDRKPLWALEKPWHRWNFEGTDQIKISMDQDEMGAWYPLLGQEVTIGLNGVETPCMVSVLSRGNGDHHVVLQRLAGPTVVRFW